MLGTWEAIDGSEGVLAYRRAHEGDERVVVVGFTGRSRAVDVGGDGWTIEVSSDGEGEGEPWSGTLGADQAVLLRPT